MHIQGIDYTRFLRERTSVYWKGAANAFVKKEKTELNAKASKDKSKRQAGNKPKR